jgi:Ni/Fe-hydrogenase subunit HybB-like protein
MILWVITGLGGAIATARMFFGLGSTINLSDGVPWGLWIGFDVMGGVALAAGGFVITATVYIFRREEFHPIVRPAVLTAFLGYIAVIVGLLFDLGLPWHIWRPMVNWQHHSVLFEVAWCVMLYTAVLALEFSPVPLEAASRYAKIRNLLLKIRLPLVIVGICLSTLHQSSLGSLFLIMPTKLHPLWYSPILPPLFFISAVGIGLLMMTLENLATAFIYRRSPEIHLLEKLGKGARWVLLFYTAVRLGDLIIRGKGKYLFDGSGYSILFWIDMLLSALLPAGLLFHKPVLKSATGFWIVSSAGVLGFVLNRICTSVIAQIKPGIPFYIPAWSEFAVSLGIVSAAILAFLYAVEHFKIWEHPPQVYASESLHKEYYVVFENHWKIFRKGYRLDRSFVMVLVAAVGFATISGQSDIKSGVEPIPVHKARGGDTLWVDGNVDGYGAVFTHRSHMRGCFRGSSCIDCHDVEPVFADGHRIGDSANDPTCVRCHHMNLPRDHNSACSACHRDMYGPNDAFGHNWHSSHQGANLKCVDCHPKDEPKTQENGKKCGNCHSDLVPEGSTIEFTHYQAPSYVDAMHKLCIECHYMKAEVLEMPDLARCATCHPGRRDFVDAPDIAARHQYPKGKRVVLPMFK